MIQICLAIETSCDDTSVALVGHDGFVHALVSANQDLVHGPYGGIVPEIAGRNHSLNLLPLIEEMFRKFDTSWTGVQGIVVTNRPGLMGSLIVGVVTAKSLAQARDLPFIGVNHLEGHIVAPFLKDEFYQSAFSMDEPFLALAISGGHTSLYLVHEFGRYEVLGATLDDAAGEAFDKFGKMIGLGFPGGVQVDHLSKGGNPSAFEFPRSMIKEDNYLMSFSGLKSSAQRLVDSLGEEKVQSQIADLCASFQQAIVEVLIAKMDRAVTKTGIKRLIITGGVSANTCLRESSTKWARNKNLILQIPPLKYCTDNAAMIGYAGILRLNRGEKSELNMGPSPHSWAHDFMEMGRS